MSVRPVVVNKLDMLVITVRLFNVPVILVTMEPVTTKSMVLNVSVILDMLVQIVQLKLMNVIVILVSLVKVQTVLT